MKPFIICEHTDFGYEHHDAVIDLNLTVYQGEYLCVVGGNGSGKSTLVKGLLGLLKPTGGALMVADELKQGGIGYLPQQTAAQRDFPATVYEVVLSGTLGKKSNQPFYSRKEKELAMSNMKRLGIETLRNTCYRELSGGQQQRVLIARALCATDQMLILDEPITGLDPSAVQDFYQLIRKLNQEDQITVIMVTHDIPNAVSQADTILHMQQRVLYYGAASDYPRSQEGIAFLGGETG